MSEAIGVVSLALKNKLTRSKSLPEHDCKSHSCSAEEPELIQSEISWSIRLALSVCAVFFPTK